MIRLFNNIDTYTDTGELDFIQFACGRLGIHNEVRLAIYHDDRVLDMYSSSDIRLDALLHKGMVPHAYNLVIRTDISNPIREILAHEMVHLSQYESGRLDLDMERRIFTWEGKEYPASLNYDLRPWEKEAFSIQRDILRSYRNINRKI